MGCFNFWKGIKKCVSHDALLSDRIDQQLSDAMVRNRRSDMHECLLNFNSSKKLLQNQLVIIAKNIDTFEGSPSLESIMANSKTFVPDFCKLLCTLLQQMIKAQTQLIGKLALNDPRDGIPNDLAQSFKINLENYLPDMLAKLYKFANMLIEPFSAEQPKRQPLLNAIIKEEQSYAETAKEFHHYEERLKHWNKTHSVNTELSLEINALFTEILNGIENLPQNKQTWARRWG